MKKVVHVITSLGDGGAEGALYRFCSTDTQSHHFVVSLLDGGKYAEYLESGGIPVYCLRMRKGNVLASFLNLWKILREIRPDLMQTWMYHADFIGGIVAYILRIKVVWGIRHTNINDPHIKKSTKLIARLCAISSSFVPHRVVCCAEAARKAHIEFGYKKEKLVVVPNGYDLERFRPDPIGRSELRGLLGISDDEIVFGMVARFDPVKDHENLIRALKVARERGLCFKCLLIGRNVVRENTDLSKKIEDAQLEKSFILLGQRVDIPAVMSALDIHILSSKDEAFPNVIAEAMACGTPCITTDAGDASEIVGDTGWVVPIGDAESLASALIGAHAEWNSGDDTWGRRKAAVRARIIGQYDLRRMIDGFHRAWG